MSRRCARVDLLSTRSSQGRHKQDDTSDCSGRHPYSLHHHLYRCESLTHSPWTPCPPPTPAAQSLRNPPKVFLLAPHLGAETDPDLAGVHVEHDKRVILVGQPALQLVASLASCTATSSPSGAGGGVMGMDTLTMLAVSESALSMTVEPLPR